MSDILRKALEEISNMDPQSYRADDLGRAARIARTALAASPAPASAQQDSPKREVVAHRYRYLCPEEGPSVWSSCSKDEAQHYRHKRRAASYEVEDLCRCDALPAEQPQRLVIDLEETEALRLRDYIDGGDRPVSLIVSDGVAGYGLYVFDTEYPDEAAEFICALNRPVNVELTTLTGELNPNLARDSAKTYRNFLLGFIGQSFDDRPELGMALDYLEEAAAMLLNLSDRVPTAPCLNEPDRFEKWTETGGRNLSHVFSLARHPNQDRYLEGATELCWLAWKAALVGGQVALPAQAGIGNALVCQMKNCNEIVDEQSMYCTNCAMAQTGRQQ